MGVDRRTEPSDASRGAAGHVKSGNNTNANHANPVADEAIKPGILAQLMERPAAANPVFAHA